MTQFATLNTFLAQCPNAAQPISETEAWVNYWDSQGTMKVYSTAYKNLVANVPTVQSDVRTLEDYYD